MSGVLRAQASLVTGRSTVGMPPRPAPRCSTGVSRSALRRSGDDVITELVHQLFIRQQWNVIAEAHEYRSSNRVSGISSRECHVGDPDSHSRDRNFDRATHETSTFVSRTAVSRHVTHPSIVLNYERNRKPRLLPICLEIDRNRAVLPKDRARSGACQQSRERVQSRPAARFIDQNRRRELALRQPRNRDRPFLSRTSVACYIPHHETKSCTRPADPEIVLEDDALVRPVDFLERRDTYDLHCVDRFYLGSALAQPEAAPHMEHDTCRRHGRSSAFDSGSRRLPERMRRIRSARGEVGNLPYIR